MSLKTALLTAALLLPLPALADDLLTVTGVGTIAVKADVARISGMTEDRAATANEALAAHRATVARLTAALTRLGVPADSLTTTSVALNPQYATGPAPAGQPRTITSYNAATQIVVTVPFDNRLAETWQALIAAGLTQSSRVNFAFRDSAAAMDQARAAALKDATAKAKSLAQQSGVTLGAIRQVTDGSNGQTLMAQNILQATLVNINNLQGQITVSDTVTVGYAIK